MGRNHTEHEAATDVEWAPVGLISEEGIAERERSEESRAIRKSLDGEIDSEEFPRLMCQERGVHGE